MLIRVTAIKKNNKKKQGAETARKVHLDLCVCSVKVLCNQCDFSWVTGRALLGPKASQLDYDYLKLEPSLSETQHL